MRSIPEVMQELVAVMEAQGLRRPLALLVEPGQERAIEAVLAREYGDLLRPSLGKAALAIGGVRIVPASEVR